MSSIILNEVLLDKKAKCTCGSCNGTGVYQGFLERDGLAVVCSYCNGKGYYTIDLDERTQIVQDIKTKATYVVEDGIIDGRVDLFRGLVKRNDIKYVVFSTARCLSPQYCFEHGVSEDEVLPYEKFLKGNLPVPESDLLCPAQLVQTYSNDDFDNDCICVGCFSDCEKFRTKKCWDKFYEGAETFEEKQAVLKRYIK